jgi:hypothetical protein
MLSEQINDRPKPRRRLRKSAVYSATGLLVAGLLFTGLQRAHADEGGVDIAKGRPVAGSAACRPGEEPPAAVNGSMGDKWCSSAATLFLQVDLGSVRTVNRFIVRHAGAGGEAQALNTRDFSISVSTDGGNFTTVSRATGNTADVSVHQVNPIAARYLRLDVQTPTTGADHAARIYEFEAYGADGPTPPPPPPTQNTCHSDAPATLTDYISDHREALTRMVCNADVAVYFDNDLRALPAAGTAWVAPFVTDVWRYIKATYGSCSVPRNLPAPIGPNCQNFGAPKPALEFLHQNKHGGGTVANRFDSFSGFRTTIDVGDTGWNAGNGVLHDELVHEACHQVEGASQGVHESPAFQIWGDSKWAEFCVYDFYANTGRAADANRVMQLFTSHRDNLPAGAQNVAWFRDWFLPLWQDNGRNGAVMQRFFGLLSQYFPTRTENGGRNLVYTRRMTTGEFVHFMSAASGRDLSGRAATVFNSGFSRSQFEQAQRDFPQMKY